MGGREDFGAASLLRHAIEEARQQAGRLSITMVCNGRSAAPPDGDFGEHSLASEFFSDSELSEMIGGLRSHGLFVDRVVNEQEFLTLAPPDAADGRQHVLMNFGSARRGPWGKTLVPALAEARGWITTNSDAYAIALARHKYHAGALLAGLGIASPRTWCFSLSAGWFGGLRPDDGTTVLIQPAYESASIGVDATAKRIVDASLEEKCQGVACAFRQDVVVRQFVAGYEVEVPVVYDACHHALDPVGIRIDGLTTVADRFLTYEQVLADDYDFYPLEDEFGSERSSKIRMTAERVSQVMGLRGLSRVDFRVDAPDGRAYVTDVSASPHFVSHSSFAFATARYGINAAAIPVALVGLALRRQVPGQPSDQC